ncbi:MAG: NAD(P)-dependent glycerol-3-phosphate dehydrogenase [Rhodospirillaceae bacterium]|jgi:glycerol-3-phosphate dehydrogenase (NAD(P)+)|nr:NAD(P)-dependent glycerol-3-phosphate dehydrogenase [Rhodospirillaceae bacterium]
MSKIGIIGAGAWGTALAMAAIRAGNEVTIQAHEPEVAEAINRHQENSVFLPTYELDPSIKATTVIADAIDADAVLLVAPAQHMRAVCEAAADDWPSGVPAIICAKGIEQGSCALMSEVVGEMLPGKPLAVLSGPTFAAEVARDLPTAVTLACDDETMAKVLMETLSARYFRIYRSRDVIGSQIGGAVKNVLAIACGIVEGRKLGDNTRAALITRGLAEISRLGIAKGAKAETLAGLSGMGDLTLTCNAMQSRNFSLGVALGSGQSLDTILGERNSVAEGVFTASSVTELARRLVVDLPICSAVDGVLNHGANIDATINGLLARPLKAETA